MITARIDAVTRVPAETPAAPRSVKVELVGRCNYRCGFCALRTRHQQPRQDMDLDFFARIARDMRAAGVEELGLFYIGESLMNPDLTVAACRIAKDIGFPYVFLTTNGSLADATTVERLMQAGLDSLKFSLNADTEAQFQAVMGVHPRLWERALHHVRQARAIRDRGRYPCRLYASSIQFDAAQQSRMQALLETAVLPYVDEHYWLPLYSMGAFATARERELGYKPIAGNQGRIGGLVPPLPCWSVFTEGHVTVDGKLSACCFDATATWTMADLHTTAFAAAWRSPAFEQLRAAHRAKDVTGTPCEHCIAYA